MHKSVRGRVLILHNHCSLWEASHQNLLLSTSLPFPIRQASLLLRWSYLDLR